MPAVAIKQPRIQFPRKLAGLAKPYRYKVLYGGRGGTKSWGLARQLLINCANRPLRVLCARETMKSLRDSVYKLLCDQIVEMRLRGFTILATVIKHRNGSEINFAGLKHNIDNIKSLESYDIVWVEEAQTTSKESWKKLIPTIRKRGSEIWVSFNPELETDDTHQRFIVNTPPNTLLVKISWRDNCWLTPELDVERRHLKRTDPTDYEHVWEGECRSSITGAIYENEIKLATAEGRICSVPVDRTKPIDTFWDLGYEDKCVIWFVQNYGGWYNFVDYLEDSGRTIEWYLIQLQQRAVACGYIYRQHWLPHDGVDGIIHKKLTGDPSKSIELIMRNMNYPVRVTPKLLVHVGINAARTIFPQCRFDADRCYEGLRALRMYQWGPVPKSGIQRREPLHDAASHGADGFRGAAVTLKPIIEVEEKPAGPRGLPPPQQDYSPFG